ncbi:hypothetical protein MNEG_0604 [Monoraphidium neglectum]|uniref:Uncharacterized protein n=1 Tax=Monoraphidium neglectum TaxID=145388 RepID=A0A0D2MXZ7_9CHLO|nr:hypothetical protein MNEG_0604 [Monoraphidium neglectum]KIZ07355.1 hypothetical protein MNEG_0604 [Monoraphidium neglectum]|eukprot:XP_013906374.1 hypothetical protein MNEG_0604 [Monoraphidium neglectum]
MPGHALLEVTGSAQSTLQAALDALGQRAVASEQRDVPSKRDVVAAAERVKSDAAKVGVMCGEAGAPSLAPDVAASLVGALQQSCLVLCAAFYALSGAAAGATLRKDVKKLAGGVVQPCIGLLRAMEGGGDLKRAIGNVWGGCDAVAKAALDNKGALFKALAGVMAVLKDTLREMQELEEGDGGGGGGSGYESDDDAGSSEAGAAAGGASTAGSACRGGGGSGGSGGAASAQGGGGANGDAAAVVGAGDTSGRLHNLRELADLDFEAGELSGRERELLSSCRALMESAAAVVKAFGRALLQESALTAGVSGPGGGEALEGWESSLFHARNLQRCVEDLGAAMYPPQDAEEVSSAADGVATTIELMIDECPAADAVGGELAALGRQLAEARERVERAAVAAAAAPVGEGGAQAVAGT